MDLTIFPLGNDDQRQSRVFRSVLLQMEAASVEFRVSLGDHHQRFHPHRRDNVAANGAKSGLRGALGKSMYGRTGNCVMRHSPKEGA